MRRDYIPQKLLKICNDCRERGGGLGHSPRLRIGPRTRTPTTASGKMNWNCLSRIANAGSQGTAYRW